MVDIVILTPSYNRLETLPKLYESLKKQTNGNFKWVIVDDGSIDETRKYINEIKGEKIVDIEYIYQENGGKARALNNGFSYSQSALVVMVVDSDDYLLPTAVYTVNNYLGEYGEDENIGAFFFHYRTSDGKILKPSGNVISNDKLVTRYEYNKIHGLNDGCICYLKRAIKKYRYPEFKGERYVGPTVIQMEMAHEYKILFSPQIIGVAEYLEGGLSKSGRQLRLKNPMGMMYYAKLMMHKKASIGTQIKYAISIWPYAKLANKSFWNVLTMVKRPILLITSYVPGQILSLYWMKKVK